MKLIVPALVLHVASLAHDVEPTGNLFGFFDKTRFLAATEANVVSGRYFDNRVTPDPVQTLDVELRPIPPSQLNFQIWSRLYPSHEEKAELSVDGRTNLDIRHLPGPVYGMGVEVLLSPSVPPSKITLTAVRSGSSVGEISIDTGPLFLPEGRFLGVWSKIPFDTLQIREATDGGERDFFGAVFATQKRPPVDQRKLVPADAFRERQFGLDVSLNGNRLLVGSMALDPSDDKGVAYILERGPNRNWREVGFLIPRLGGEALDAGREMALGPNWALISSIVYSQPNFVQSARLFAFNRDDRGVWQQSQQLLGHDSDDQDIFGVVMETENNRALIGAPASIAEDGRSGAAYIFERTDHGQWVEVVKLIPPESDGIRGFGSQLSLNGDRAVVISSGGPGSSERGFVFDRMPDGTWMYMETLELPLDSTCSSGDLAVSEDWLFIGCSRTQSLSGFTGFVDVYKRQESNQWVESQTLRPSAESRRFGASIDLADDQVLIGASSSVDGGAAFVFDLMDDGRWHQSAKYQPVDGDRGKNAGATIAMSSTLVVTGAPSDSDRGTRSGAVYVFERGLIFGNGFEEF